MSDRNVIYACYIGDGYALPEPPASPDDTAAEGARYWYSPRNSEHTCGSCDGTGRHGYVDARGRDRSRPCTACDGDGHQVGEPFTVTRYTFADAEVADRVHAACEDASDGYDRATVLEDAVRAGLAVSVDVLDWDPEHDHDDGGPPCACDACDGDGWLYTGEGSDRDDCPECDGTGYGEG